METTQLRNDGRFPEEFRTVECSFKKQENQGVVYWRQGNSIVNTSIAHNRDKQQLAVNLNFLESSRSEPMNERRVYEMRQKLLSVITALVSAEAQIEINVDIICDDGSIFSVIFNSISMACMYSGVSMTGSCASVTVNKCVDLNYREEGRPFSVCVVFSPSMEKILHLEAFGRIQRYEFEDALRMGVEMCRRQHNKFRELASAII